MDVATFWQHFSMLLPIAFSRPRPLPLSYNIMNNNTEYCM